MILGFVSIGDRASKGVYRDEGIPALKEWLLEQANKDVRSGARAIPGFEIKHERVAR